MRRLTVEEIKELLAPLRLKIGEWGQVCDASDHQPIGGEWLNYPAPEGALSLYCFAHWVLQLLPHGKWYIVQVDNSTCLSDDEEYLASRLLFGPGSSGLIGESRSFLFEIKEDGKPQERWLIGNLLHLILLFSGHCQVVSAESSQGEILSLQDGYIYLISRHPNTLASARLLLKEFEAAPLQSPSP